MNGEENMEVILQTDKLAKQFGNQVLFSNTNLLIGKGKTVGLVGANGTGKSTLLKIIAGFMPPTSGKVIYDKKLRMNYIPDRFPKLNISMEELLPNIGIIDGLSQKECSEKLNLYYEKFQLTEMIRTPLKFLSKGSLQKVSVIQALLGKSDILLLDEPLSGQDMESQLLFIEEIKQCKREGMTILLACHEPYLIGQLADEVYRIHRHCWTKVSVEEFRHDTKVVIKISSNADTLQELLRSSQIRMLIKENDKETLIFCEKSQGAQLLEFLIHNNRNLIDYHEFGREEDYYNVKGAYELK